MRRLQGFPEEFIVGTVSPCQTYKQLGNSVAVPVIGVVANAMIDLMKDKDSIRDAA